MLRRGRGRRATEPTLGWKPCPYCGYCHHLEAWAAAAWHEQHDASMGLQTYELKTEER